MKRDFMFHFLISKSWRKRLKQVEIFSPSPHETQIHQMRNWRSQKTF